MCKEELRRIPVYKIGKRKANEWNPEDSQKDRRWPRRVCDVGTRERQWQGGGGKAGQKAWRQSEPGKRQSLWVCKPEIKWSQWQLYFKRHYQKPENDGWEVNKTWRNLKGKHRLPVQDTSWSQDLRKAFTVLTWVFCSRAKGNGKGQIGIEKRYNWH